MVGPEPQEATFASNVIRRSCSVAPWPGQLNRSTASFLNMPIADFKNEAEYQEETGEKIK
jgi:hypothetical protein